MDTKNPERGPLLIIDGEKGNTVPWAIANASFKRQQRNEGVSEIVKIPNRGHSLTIDSGRGKSPTPPCGSSSASSTPDAAGRRPWPRPSSVRTQEGQQVGVHGFGLRRRHAVRESLVGLQRPVLHEFRGQRVRVGVGNDTVPSSPCITSTSTVIVLRSSVKSVWEKATNPS